MTPQGQYGRYKWRQRHHWSHYLFNMEPKSKKAMKKPEKVLFQQEILKQMKELHRTAYRSKIVAEFDIMPTSQNPPHIHTAMKNILDLFSKPLPESGIRRKGLVYQDDKQIAYLSVNYHLGNAIPLISASFVPLKNFLEDLKLTEEILAGEYDEFDYFDRRDFLEDIKEFEDLNEEPNEDLLWDEHRNLLRNKESYIKNFGQTIYESLIKLDRKQLQENFLKKCRLGVRNLYTLYRAAGEVSKFENLFNSDMQEWSQNLTRDLVQWIVDSPVKIQLSRVPIKEGETQKFKDQIKDSLKKYKERFPILNPLYIPVSLEVIYKPPPVSAGFFKDLDNIMREHILPIFNEEFKPPPTFISTIELDKISDKTLREKFQQKIDGLPKSVKYSVTGYEIIEIPRHQKDRDNGFINIGITTSLFRSSSNLKNVNSIIEKWYQYHDRRY